MLVQYLSSPSRTVMHCTAMTVSVSLRLWLDKSVSAWTGPVHDYKHASIFGTGYQFVFLFERIELAVISVNHYEALQEEKEKKICSGHFIHHAKWFVSIGSPGYTGDLKGFSPFYKEFYVVTLFGGRKGDLFIIFFYKISSFIWS